MEKLIIIMGKSGSGKSTIERILEKDHGFKRAISTTTRPPRSEEVPFIDYYFIPEEVFQIYKKRGEFLETSKYPTADTMYSYGVHKKDITIDKEDNILVTERSGYEQLLKSVGRENIISILIEADKEKRADRYRKRDKNYKEEDIVSRGERDDKIFAGLEDEVDLVVRNNRDIKDTIKIILHEINLIKNNDILAECRVDEAEEFMSEDKDSFMFDFSDCHSIIVEEDDKYRTVMFANYIHIPNLQIDIHEGFGEYYNEEEKEFQVDFSCYMLYDSIKREWLYLEDSSLPICLLNYFKDDKVLDYKAKFVKVN